MSRSQQFRIVCTAMLLIIIPHSEVHSEDPASQWTIMDRRENIEVFSEFDPGMETLWMHLTSVQQEMQQQLDLRVTSDSIQIVIFSSRRRYLQYLGDQIRDSRFRKAIFFRNEDVSQIYAYRSSELLTDLRHEFTHVILHQNLPFVPLWIDEGLAEFLETPPEERQNSNRISGARWRARLGGITSLSDLESLPSASEMTADNYRDSWTWVHFLLSDSTETREIFQSYISTIARGEAPGPFSRVFRTRVGSPENRINSYFRKSRN